VSAVHSSPTRNAANESAFGRVNDESSTRECVTEGRRPSKKRFDGFSDGCGGTGLDGFTRREFGVPDTVTPPSRGRRLVRRRPCDPPRYPSTYCHHASVGSNDNNDSNDCRGHTRPFFFSFRRARRRNEISDYESRIALVHFNNDETVSAVRGGV